MRKTNCRHDELVFLAQVIKECRRSRRRLLQMCLGLNNRRRVLKLGFFYLLLILWYYCLSYSQRNIIVPRSAHSCRRFRRDSFVIFSKKTWLAVRHRTACFPTCYTRFQIRKTTYRSGLCTSRKYHFRTFEVWGTQIFSIFLPLCSKRSKQVVCAWQKQETCRTLGKN